ncbi:MAG: small ribosomal subunit Rsm22 family protein [Parachlamydiaceae bacterium]
MKTHKKSPTPDLQTIIPILIGVWRRFNKLSGPADALQTREFRGVVAAVKALQEKSLNGQSLIGQDYFKNQELAGAYMLYDWILHYQQGLSLIGELPEPPKRVLDICSGGAPFAFAAMRHGAEDVTATDQNGTILQLGAEVSGRYGLPLAVRKWNCLNQRIPLDGQFDLIILGHCLGELFPSTEKGWVERQHAFVKSLFNKLTPTGHLLIVDNSFIEANRRVLQLRDTLVAEGVPVQSPCVWRGECPALKMQNSPCYAQRECEKPYLIKEIQRAASINLSSLKMTYIIFRNPVAGWPDIGDKPLYRVISPPVDTFKGKRFYLCGTDGKKQLESHLSVHPIESRAFEYLRRGELISITNGLEKQNAIDIIETTTVKVQAACGKPIPEINPTGSED